MTKPTNNVQTEVLTLEKINTGRYQFLIPSYQRPYVWPDDDVLKLFDDIKRANECNEDSYFIGTVLTSKSKDESGDDIFELIDGQQRTTTLMLIALAFKMAKADLKLADLAVFENRPRLQFAIREQVQHLLGSLAGLTEKYHFPGSEAIAQDDYLKRIDAALNVLSQQVRKLSVKKRRSLGHFIYSKVQWVNNIVPATMDLNRLFATMNTAGIQLEQADILKAKLLKQVKSDKATYDAIWVACEHLENYFERNVRKVFPKANWNDIKPKHLAHFDQARFTGHGSHLGESTAKTALNIDKLYQQTRNDLLQTNTTPKIKTKLDAYEPEIKTVYCRSIITFPLLLIHAYRIYLAQKSHDDIAQRLHSDRLLEIFEAMSSAPEAEVKAFIEILWQVRYQFDRWVVKWVEQDDSNDERLLLTTQSRSKSDGKYYISRSATEVSDLVQLQSVRNFTGERSAQYWLTPFIAGLIKDGVTSELQALALLECLDNQLSLTSDDETQKSASFKQATGKQLGQVKISKKLDYLREANGTYFEHYWFQKLEYLLWKKESKKWETGSKNKSLDEDEKKLKKYRITSRNSIEHVHPQNEEYQRQLLREQLDSFGNLVLLSPSENSSYSNQTVKKKKADFEDKPHYDSLKLRALFRRMDDKGGWDEKLIESHLHDMLRTLKKHYTEVES